jgi:hypothetical protein
MNAMDRALAQINDMFAERDARKAMIDADPRIIFLRKLRTSLSPDYEAGGVAGFAELTRRIEDGTVARSRRATELIRARTAMLDHFPHVARQHLREAAIIRRQAPYRPAPMTAAEVAGAVNLKRGGGPKVQTIVARGGVN